MSSAVSVLPTDRWHASWKSSFCQTWASLGYDFWIQKLRDSTANSDSVGGRNMTKFWKNKQKQTGLTAQLVMSCHVFPPTFLPHPQSFLAMPMRHVVSTHASIDWIRNQSWRPLLRKRRLRREVDGMMGWWEAQGCAGDDFNGWESGSPKRWEKGGIVHPPIGRSIYHLYTTYSPCLLEGYMLPTTF